MAVDIINKYLPGRKFWVPVWIWKKRRLNNSEDKKPNSVHYHQHMLYVGLRQENSYLLRKENMFFSKLIDYVIIL